MEPLYPQLRERLRSGDLDGVAGLAPVDRRDRFLALLEFYDLHLARVKAEGPRKRLTWFTAAGPRRTAAGAPGRRRSEGAAGGALARGAGGPVACGAP